MTATATNLQEAYLDKRRVTVVGAVINLVLAFAKIVFGLLGNSQALVADGVHSLSDLASDAMVLVAAKYNSMGADEEHPYGHARFETVATIGLGVLLLTVAVGITLDAVDRIMNPEKLLQPGVLALVVTVFSILSKEWLYWYTVKVADRINSDLLRANAWHHRSDAISSVVVLVGIVGVMAGQPYLDAVAAIGVSIMIGKIGWSLGWGGVRELVDTGVEPEALQDIIETIESVDGVREFHMLRTRRMGGEVLVEVHILVDPDVTVSEGHMIGDRVLVQLKRQHRDIGDVMIHVDPEDDTHEQTRVLLPGRSEILKQLKTSWQPVSEAEAIEKINLHYLEGQVDVEVVLPMKVTADFADARRLANELADHAQNQPPIGKVDVLFR
ncbi:MAG: cation diffusion facilitator family transporter [Gammaproteobacteria bacterium]|nr:cation diffusion facilitator family transporter [Gammaproteobacteria bacterium]